MEAKELMIGDWVRILLVKDILKEYNAQVKQLTYDDILDSYYVEDEGNCVALKYVEPILLTEEILKKNGFFRNMPNSNCWMYVEHWAKEEGEDKCDVYVHLHEDSYFLEIENSYNDDALYERTLHFVHECQHALRLCGLAELADNFKI